MLHYLDYGTGILVGRSVKLRVSPIASLVVGVSVPVFWHIPYPFALAASSSGVEVLAVLTLTCSGILLGGILDSLTRKFKFYLLGLWMTGDTVLSTIFMTGGAYYTSRYIVTSPYSSSQLGFAGIAMFIFMNVTVVILIIKLLNDMFREELDKTEYHNV
ncbi:hypothetical protein HS1genome_1399 [Sulfodiicoccus acidiphilus]|uniref:Uncharacterized protein n=1 Tax=Sulfodiicoccus acidiphilus TaxID=1670455 RepID=A0A348B4A8_9CREN|nr:hypothetical protein HS1genome_1399 [Sulfodiicoccus acidiphilus]GGU04535.1 hypothetical protein GCM10007116_21430 [Sulfodiicoccus acidiphilus]